MSALNEEQKALAETFLVPFESAQQLRDWAFYFLGIDFPLGSVDPMSNSSPSEWLFEAYTAVKDNLGGAKPTYVVYSSRDSYKTLSCAALEVIVMVHFQVTVAHMAAIEPQSKKAVQYINSFLRKIKPYIEYHGRNIESQNTRNVAIKNKEGEICYLTIIICTLTGANCIHPDTVVHYFDGTQKLARDVVPGDVLKTWDYHANQDVSAEVGMISYTEKQSREIVFEDGSNLILSDDHQVFTQKGWIPAAKVKIGDRFTETSGEIIKTQYTPEEIKIGNLYQCILGTLLGDASLYRTKNKIRFQVSHSSKQLKYLEYIKSIFLSNGIEVSITPDSKGQHKLTTKTHPLFEEFIHLYSPTKKITKDWLDNLTWEGVAYWFMDDVRGNGQVVGKRKDHCFELATCCFSYEENEIIRDWFIAKGFECKIDTVTNSSKVRYNIIKFSLGASRDLSDKLRDYFLPDMMYKLLPSKELNFTRCLNTGKLINKINGHGFSYLSDSPHSTRAGRSWVGTINSKLTSAVKEIVLIGKQKLIDIHIKTDNEHRKSFYANSMKLIHNSEHTNIMVIDEVDVVRFPQAYEEAKLIPGVLKGRHPITIMTSTRKFAFGLMQKEIDSANEHNYPVLHWNIIDITEKCQTERHLPDLPKEHRYIAKNLPLRNISGSEYSSLQEEKKSSYESIEAFAGCAICPLLPVCKMRLAHRPEKDIGGLYKPIEFTINQFRKVNPDMGEAQLLCWKPSSQGLIYGRFDATEGENTLTLDQAYERFTGITAKGIVLDDLIEAFHRKGINFYIGGDWGFRHAYALVACAVLPSKEFWIFETLAMPGLEFEDMIKYAIYMRDKYRPKKWFMDTAQPMFIKGFRRRKMPCKDFKKDIMGGIESIRGQIVDGTGRRYLKILKTEENNFLIKGFGHHHFMTDAAGVITKEPDDEEYADVMDSVRYIGQNLFEPKGKVRAGSGAEVPESQRKKRQELYEQDPMKIHSDIMVNRIRKLSVDGVGDSKGKSESGQVLWDFSDVFKDN